jgi:hypothetical protein
MNTGTYHYVWHITMPNGLIQSHHATNDDDDDGAPDDKVTHWAIQAQPKEQALRSPYDRSHIGCSGVHVHVYLDGKELF